MELKENINEAKQSSIIEWTNHSKQVLHFLASHKASGTKRNDKLLLKSFENSKMLFEKDIPVDIIDNYGDKELCNSYPIKIIIQRSFNQHISNKNDNINNLTKLFDNARFGRVRCRFVVPVIFLANNLCIARSGTLSCTKELWLNKSIFTLSNNSKTVNSPIGTDLDVLRAADINLLNHLNIKYIFDLMVENHRNFGWNYCSTKISSSEKADKFNRYKSFYINGIPYPGCDWFGKFKNNKYYRKTPKWNNALHDANLILSDKNVNKIKFYKNYKEWDIILLTQNYLILILDCVKNSNNGLLIHCVSGWDRTPLMICLIRLSLWADGIIHSSLNSAEILYLTLAYDWLLFTHQLGLRLKTGENIFSFCFFMLQWITDKKYSILNDEMQQKQRKSKLMDVFNIYNIVWKDVMNSNNPPKKK
eukprot:205961_1